MNSAMNAARSLGSEVEARKEIHSFLDAEQEQMLGLSSLMSRSEDLADRICGTAPVGPGNDTKAMDPGGLMGAIGSLHNHRDQMIDRISGALSRIERVL